ncbi:C-C motif chemokine 27a [Rhinichthys klamathensis goyatoka]|uniref:C-C motif chemokine 27a n=1 Tax=Rhinichthys klamathensis goyatoka TaxID=3034132 RepID=UPI0024B5D07D|nr:C-C motif chemokine 27a [Rhinichthys klamathensis goyatoka]
MIFLSSFTVTDVSTMELKATSLLLLTCVAIIILTEASTNAIPTCCLAVTGKIPRQKLHHVKRYDTQSRSGRCEIDALILHIGKRKICAHPKLRKVLDKIMKNRKHKRP